MKSYSTWINLSARAALSYPAEGVPSDRGRRQSGRRRDRRGGETDKNHLSLTQWTISRSRGERSETREPKNQQERTRRKSKARASSILERDLCVGGQAGVPAAAPSRTWPTPRVRGRHARRLRDGVAVAGQAEVF